ncbi:hypothetical protein BpHYR1_032790 [Brachionus plicatilis]|uniref:Uncharacterized protein n=1 Tax=Brachionus plicatilis TaxID=10195 RepID=A0A3M7ST66_BRAPC|nr:hypothetical protein BpHYR1_032790 [Brachionus plicatilis]
MSIKKKLSLSLLNKNKLQTNRLFSNFQQKLQFNFLLLKDRVGAEAGERGWGREGVTHIFDKSYIHFFHDLNLPVGFGLDSKLIPRLNGLPRDPSPNSLGQIFDQ